MRFKKRVLGLIFVLVISFFPITTGATTREFTIPKVEVNATINDDGTVDVVERVTYDFNGDYNGIVRKFNNIYNENFLINNVKIIDKNSNEIEAKEGYEALENTYEINAAADTEIKLYTKSSNESKIVEIKYTLKNVISKSDTEARLNWNFYGVENVGKVDSAILKVKLNGAAFDDTNCKYHIYSDGNITSNYDDGAIRMSIGNLTSSLAVDLTFPSEYIPNAPISNYLEENKNNNYDESINIPAQKDDAAGLVVVIIAGIVGIILFFIIKENKETAKAIEEYRSTEVYTHDDFYHSPPVPNLPPAIVNIIINDGKASKNMMFLSLFYLAHKGYYKIENIKIEKTWSTKEDLIFTRNTDIEEPKEEHLKKLIEIFKAFEDNYSFSMLGIKEKFKKSSYANDFRSDIDLWIDKLIEDIDKMDMLTEIKKKKILTNYYNNEKDKWTLYKAYLKKLIESEISEDMLKDSTLLLIYAVALNIDSYTLKDFNNKLLDVAKLNNNNSNYDDLLYHNNYFMYYPLYNTLHNDVQHSVIPDSSSGGFDGSSSGGDFGGGGGGGSDAF